MSHQRRDEELGPCSVLVVEDDEDQRALVRLWLASDDRFELVGEADNGADAIETARHLQPRIIVMDVRIPRGGGEEATRIIGSLCPDTRVLAYSALSDRRYVLEMIGSGVHGYLVKTGSSAEFLSALSIIAQGGTYLSSSAGNDVFDHVRGSLERQRTLEHALEPGALRVALQPIVDITSGTTIGYEALARFADTEGPGPVFAAAKHAGRGVEMELTTARAAVAVARQLGDDVDFVCVNTSPETALTPAFREILAAAAPERTVIELTENSEVQDYPRLRAVLDPLRADGFRVAVDDVGGGFASLSHVHQLEPDLIKSDRYLVQHVDSDQMRQSMISALAAIAERSGARLVGEGVETDPELEMLRELGVELAQGFLLGVPEITDIADLTRVELGGA